MNIEHGREAEGKAIQRDVEKDKGIENRIEEQKNGDHIRGNRKFHIPRTWFEAQDCIVKFLS